MQLSAPALGRATAVASKGRGRAARGKSQGVVSRTGARLAGGTLLPHISIMARTLTDTDPAAAEIMADLHARMTPAEKLARVHDLVLTTSRLALAGLRGRYPDETESELLLRLARLRLGAEVVERVYSSKPEADGA